MDSDDDLPFNPSLFLEAEFTTEVFNFGTFDVELRQMSMDKVKDSPAEFDRIGHALWASAHVLSRYLLHNRHLVNDTDVLELGCGLGLVGIVAAKLSLDPSRVLLTDGDQHIFDALDVNLEQNFSNNKPRSAYLWWGDNLQAFRESHGSYDVILGADVLYGESCVLPLIQTVQYLLKDDNSRYLMVFQKQFGGRFKDSLLDSAEACGLDYRQIDWESTRGDLDQIHLGCRETLDVEFFEFMKKKS